MGRGVWVWACALLLAACGEDGGGDEPQGGVILPPPGGSGVPVTGAMGGESTAAPPVAQAPASVQEPGASAGEAGSAAPALPMDPTQAPAADDASPMPQPGGPTALPTPTAPCPELVDGVVTFAPAGLAVHAEGPSWNPGPVGELRDPSLHTREVTLWMDAQAAREQEGPVVFYWYGTGSSPREAEWGGLTPPVIEAIKAEGGIIALPTHDGENTYPWYIANGRPEPYDLMVADEVLACAIEQLGVDTRRIHSLGLSAGGMMTTQLAYLRSSYVASVVSYSGALGRPPQHEDPSNLFAHMGTHGGPTDTGGQLDFMETTETIHDDLKAKGHFSIVCDNSPAGHTIPRGIGPFSWEFLEAHPYGTAPSPWLDGLPSNAPDYCSGE